MSEKLSTTIMTGPGNLPARFVWSPSVSNLPDSVSLSVVYINSEVSTQIESLNTKVNELLSVLRTHGLIEE